MTGPADRLPRQPVRERRACCSASCSWSSTSPPGQESEGLFVLMLCAALAVRRAADHPGRRRRHAGRDLDAERVHRAVRGGRRLRARQQRADHRRLAGRLLGNAADDHDGPGDEPLARERAVRRLRRQVAGRRARPAPRRRHGARGDRHRRRDDARLRRQGDRRARLRAGGRAGAAHGARAGRRAREARRRGELRDPPGRRAACPAT